MYYTREQLRDFIKCPQLGSIEYGAWGALRLEQRLAISNLLDQLDSADAYIRQLEKENEEMAKHIEKHCTAFLENYGASAEDWKLYFRKRCEDENRN